jgi:hypothetical protein
LQRTRPAPSRRDLKPAPTCSTLPDLWPLNHPADFGEAQGTRHRAPVNHTGSHSPSQVSCRLRSVGHVASGSSPRPCIVGPRLPPRPSLRGVLPRFRGYEGRSDPLPADAECSQFGTVSDRAYRQAVTRLSWLSYSPSGISPERRSQSLDRSLPSPTESSPRRPG